MSEQETINLGGHKVGNRYHIAFALRLVTYYLERDELAGKKQSLLSKNGHFLTYEQAREEIAQLRKQGYELLPPCDNYDSRGACLGHPA